MKRSFNSSNYGKILACLLLFSCTSTAPAFKSLKYEHLIPLEVESTRSDAVIHVRADVDGQSVHFLLDTGSYQTQVSDNDFFKKYPISAQRNMRGVYSTDFFPEIEVNSIVANQVSFNLHKIIRRPQIGMNEGLLGIDAFKDRTFVLDLHRPHDAKLSFEEKFPEELSPNKITLGRDGHMILDSEFDGMSIPALFDTGATESIFPPALLQKHPNSFQFIRYSFVTDINGKSVKEEHYILKQWRVGRLLLKEIPVMIVENQIKSNDAFQIILGAKEMMGLRWVFDLRQKIWAVW